MTIASTAQAAARKAIDSDQLDLLIRGDWPYFVPEEHMAPSNVPTNWAATILYGLDPAAADTPDLSSRIEDALILATNTPEGTYCSMEFLKTYMLLRGRRPLRLLIDVDRVAAALRSATSSQMNELRSCHPDWLGPTNEKLWERIFRVNSLIEQKTGIVLLPGIRP
jgi:hypothetical protein